MSREEIKEKLLSIIHDVRPDIVPGDDSLFNTINNCLPFEMLYILLSVRDTFGIVIDDAFVERIRYMTVSSLVEAIISAREVCTHPG